MAANGQVEMAWGDGDQVFNIAKVGVALELEAKCECGVSEIFDRLRNGRWWLNDVRETLRLGLIGGGMEPAKALILIKRYVDNRPWAESVQPAMAVLMAALVGVPGDDIGKKPPADRTTEANQAPSSVPMDASSAPPSMDSPQAADGTLAPPTI